MTVVWVEHRGHGCESGCCGHAVHIDDDEGPREVTYRMDHPYGEDPQSFARALIERELGPGHAADLDWGRSLVVDD